MYHTIEFAVEVKAEVQLAPMRKPELAVMQRGTQVKAQVKPYVVETDNGLFEVADLTFEDGSATRCVPFAYFAFVE